MWSFSKISRQETRAHSKLADFFETNKGGNAGDAESLVRESLQNALDAKSNKFHHSPVRVKITVGHQLRSKVGWMFDTFDTHVKVVREETKRNFPTEIPESFQYVLIEDFNTSGFDGTFNNEDDKQKGSLVRFWWEEGTSEKRKGAGGSHGVGKVTLSEASRSRVFFGYTKREEDDDELLFGYCRLGLHSFEEKRYRDYARFGVTITDTHDEDPQLYPYSRLTSKKKEIEAIEKFKDAYKIDRKSPGASILIPNVDELALNLTKLIEAVLDNFYLPILKDLLTVEFVDEDSNFSETLDAKSFKAFTNEHKAEDPEFTEKVDLALFLINGGGFYTSSPEFQFNSESKQVSSAVFAEERLKEIRDDYASGKPVKVKLNVPLFPVGEEPENGLFNIALKRRQNHKEGRAFCEVFRGEVRIKDENIGTGKANAILDVFGALNEEKQNALSEFMKYCEDPGHRNWNAAINRRNEPFHYKHDQTWQKNLVRRSVHNLVQVLENEDEKKIEDFADDIFFFIKHVETEVPGKEQDKEGIEGKNNKDKKVVTTVPPDHPGAPLVSISKIDNGVRIKPTKHFRGASVDINLIPAIEAVMCYEMFGSTKATWRRYGKMEIDLNDTETYSKKEDNVEIFEVDRNQLKFRPISTNFCLEISGFDPNRQLYVDIKDSKIAKLISGGLDDNS